MVCKFIGWSTANTDCETWGNYSTVASTNYSTLWHSGHGINSWAHFPSEGDTTSTISKKSDNTNKWVFPTGTFVTANGRNTVQKNIYDLAGNVSEWTTEIPAYGNGANAIRRGGAVSDNGSVRFATYRTGGSSSTSEKYWDIGFRFVLYVSTV